MLWQILCFRMPVLDHLPVLEHILVLEHLYKYILVIEMCYY